MALSVPNPRALVLSKIGIIPDGAVAEIANPRANHNDKGMLNKPYEITAIVVTSTN